MGLNLNACFGPLPKGVFGFGDSRQSIRAYQTMPVFASNKPIYWVYQLKSLGRNNLFGVKLERSQLGWMPIETISLKADREFLVLSNNYPPMRDGLYKITIYHDQEILDSATFRLIEDELP